MTKLYLNNCTAVPQINNGRVGTFYGVNTDKITVYVKDEDMKKKFEADPNWNSKGFTFAVAPTE